MDSMRIDYTGGLLAALDVRHGSVPRAQTLKESKTGARVVSPPSGKEVYISASKDKFRPERRAFNRIYTCKTSPSRATIS